MTKRILIIEDNIDLVHLLEIHLKDLAFEVDFATDGVAGFAKACEQQFDLIVLDIMLPKLDGLEVCKQLRFTRPYVPILILTSKSSELDRIVGLEIGADDYVTKPFSVMELMARVKAILRRIEKTAEYKTNCQTSIQADALAIDPQKRQVTLKDKRIDLTAKEFDLLCYFASHPGLVFTRSQLLANVWGYAHEGYDHTVNSHINRLRAKIEENPNHPRYILTVWGVGYKFADWKQPAEN